MYTQVEALYKAGVRDIAALEAAAAAAAARVGITLQYIAFNRQADGAPLTPPWGLEDQQQQQQQQKEGPLLLPVNDEICVSVAFAAAPDCSIVDNFVLSDTDK